MLSARFSAARAAAAPALALASALYGCASRGATVADDSLNLRINAYVWRASLETLSFLPLRALDPFSGVLLTDWHASPQAPSERFRLTAYVLDKRLHPQALHVTVFRQKRDSNGKWQDADVSPQLARQIENLILSRARTLRLSGRAGLG